MRCLATFDVTSMAVLFERVCRKEGIAAKIVPVPRSLSTSCGLACEFPCESAKAVHALCSARQLDVTEFHTMEG